MNNEGQILIIPDVHGRDFWREAVELHPDCPTIFLGDYVDPYPAEQIAPDRALTVLSDILSLAAERPNVTLLLGNHDLHYLCDFGESCRYDRANAHAIRELLLDDLSLLNIATLRTVGDKRVVFSHAPIMQKWIDSVGETTDADALVAHMNAMLARVAEEPRATAHYLGHISMMRGGFLDYGSPVWADVRDINRDLLPTVDYSVFGHTQLRSDPIITSYCACLDCRRAFLLSPDLTFRACPII